MVEQLCAYSIILWLFPVGPLVLISIGIQVGRHGWRHVITAALLKVFGVSKEGFTA